MPVEQRGQAIRVMINLVNWQQDEPTGCGGGRQLSMNGTSRVSREAQARICERLGVRFPGATRPSTELRFVSTAGVYEDLPCCVGANHPRSAQWRATEL